ncbi:MAG: hypothetical protein CK424_01525 [Legionella sp.]|nr:MAG: hypothetical protein CK424_01525 [Legionella sp.]
MLNKQPLYDAKKNTLTVAIAYINARSAVINEALIFIDGKIRELTEKIQDQSQNHEEMSRNMELKNKMENLRDASIKPLIQSLISCKNQVLSIHPSNDTALLLNDPFLGSDRDNLPNTLFSNFSYLHMKQSEEIFRAAHMHEQSLHALRSRTIKILMRTLFSIAIISMIAVSVVLAICVNSTIGFAILGVTGLLSTYFAKRFKHDYENWVKLATTIDETIYLGEAGKSLFPELDRLISRENGILYNYRAKKWPVSPVKPHLNYQRCIQLLRTHYESNVDTNGYYLYVDQKKEILTLLINTTHISQVVEILNSIYPNVSGRYVKGWDILNSSDLTINVTSLFYPSFYTTFFTKYNSMQRCFVNNLRIEIQSYQDKIQNMPQFDMDDLGFFRSQGMCLRHVELSLGKKEVEKGGIGDSVSLANFGRPYTVATFSRIKSGERFGQNDDAYFICKRFQDELIKFIYASYIGYHLRSFNDAAFILLNRPRARQPYDFESYPLGKVGSGEFSAASIYSMVTSEAYEDNTIEEATLHTFNDLRTYLKALKIQKTEALLEHPKVKNQPRLIHILNTLLDLYRQDIVIESDIFLKVFLFVTPSTEINLFDLDHFSHEAENLEEHLMQELQQVDMSVIKRGVDISDLDESYNLRLLSRLA